MRFYCLDEGNGQTRDAGTQTEWVGQAQPACGGQRFCVCTKCAAVVELGDEYMDVRGMISLYEGKLDCYGLWA